MKKQLTVLLAFGATQAFSQGIGNEEITITKEREVELQKQSRVFEKIPVEEKKTTKREMVYTFFERKPVGIEEVEFKPNVVSPVEDQRRNNSQSSGYPNYVKIGGGNFGRFYAETFLHSDQNQNLVFGLYGLHNAAKRGPIQGLNSGINLDQIKVDGKYHSGYFKLQAEAGFERRNYYFFGYDTLANRDLEPEEIRQRINQFDFGVAFENTKPKPIIDYSLKTNLRSFNDLYSTGEIDWSTNFTSIFGVIPDRLAAIIEADAYVTEISDEFQDSFIKKRNLFRVAPFFNLDFRSFNAKFGFKAVNEFDQVNQINNTKGFPTVTLTYKTPGIYYFSAGYDGDIIRNTLNSFYEENPWLGPQLDVRNTTKDFEVFASSKGDITTGMKYSLRASYGKFSNLHFFNVDRDFDPNGNLLNKFYIEYEEDPAQFVNVSAQLDYQPKDFWRLDLTADYWYYETINFNYAYHRPNFEGRIGNTFVVSDKIVSNIDFYYIGSTFAKDPLSGDLNILDIKIPAITDLNAEFTYLFSEQFSAFVKLNNIIGKNYQRYLYYPQQGLNFLVGINVSL
ncbi:hypothetical protein [Jiulongibacter sp. NS-SX5]|uniref:hypothetical protein n=1 Tax=Jiulongibacter sp. NS-SX5 TaxID=3463854 RepID=UPI00405A4193